jgi:Protein of unknown function (DUF2946)
MIWRRNNRGTRPAAWLAVFAILLQVLLPVAQSPASMTPVGLGGDVIAGLDIAQNLCHAPGDTAPDNHGPAPVDHRQCCDFCLAVHAVGGFAPPSAPVIAVSREYGIVVPVEAALVLPRRQANATQQARAPPVLI